MAITDAINTDGNLYAAYPELTVLLGGTSGAPPTDLFPLVYCTRVVQSASGSRLDFADLEFVVTGPLTNRTQPAEFSRMIDIIMPDADTTALSTRLLRGDYTRESASVTHDGESLSGQVQMRNYHFGNPLKYYDVFEVDELSTRIHSDAVFNPRIDDRVLGNMSNKNREDDADLGHLWAHPESISSTIGETYQDQTRSKWTLDEAVKSMCWLLNPDEQFVLNPESSSITLLAGAPELLAVSVPLGSRLPQALDLLLIPLGYNWYLDYTGLFPRITIFKIGTGTERELYFQSPGESLNLTDSNVNQFSTDNNIGDSFNQVTVYGSFEEAECTFTLYPGWDATHDEVAYSDLEKDGEEYSGKETVWRLFIANEAGDIDPETERLGQMPVVPDLTGIFELWVPHRRQLAEPLTYIAGTPSAATQLQVRRPHVIEYSADAGVTWLAADEKWTIKLCPDQIGILFDSKSIPEELYDAGENCRVRITGTVQGDSRINYTADRQNWAVNGRTVEQVILRPDKFEYRIRNSAGTFASVLTGTADTKDDTTEIQAFAESLRDQNQYAEIDCEFRLPGWHLQYQIGDLITKIAGREISLDGAPRSAPERRYVQVVERRFEMGPGGPSTVLIVDRGVAENATRTATPSATKSTDAIFTTAESFEGDRMAKVRAAL